jgi:EAL domain-containing protein (putative c-di-GMP-specific phosphodiesterase class I)
VLLRMTDEHGQIIPPGNFIPAAERYGLMPALDRWVVTHALHTLARYPKQLREIHTCAINLSGMSLGDESLLGFLQQQIENSTFRRRFCALKSPKPAPLPTWTMPSA